MKVNGYTIGPNQNLSYANLLGANLLGANLLGANLLGANLSGAKNIPTTISTTLQVLPDLSPY